MQIKNIILTVKCFFKQIKDLRLCIVVWEEIWLISDKSLSINNLFKGIKGKQAPTIRAKKSRIKDKLKYKKQP